MPTRRSRRLALAACVLVVAVLAVAAVLSTSDGAARWATLLRIAGGLAIGGAVGDLSARAVMRQRGATRLAMRPVPTLAWALVGAASVAGSAILASVHAGDLVVFALIAGALLWMWRIGAAAE